MDLRLTDDETRFRDDLRAWLREAVPALGPAPADVHDWTALREHEARWQRMLFDAGYAGVNWPAEYGGQGRSPTEHLLFLEESARAGAPETNIMFVGLLHAGPTLMAEASAEQKAAHLPRILRGDEVWCQGFSEPGAGSDLASLRTRAVRARGVGGPDGESDEYVVNGQKIWTSNAQVADFCELLVRTDPDAPKHKGISWVILPMSTPGITIRPLTTITGSQEFSEVFFDDVRVPVANRVGDENDGWRISMVTFSFERGTAFTSEMLQSFDLLRDLKARSQANGTWDDAGVRRSLGRLAADLDALWALTKRNVSQASRTGVPGVGGSVFKLHYSEMRKRMGALAMEVMGPSAVDLSDLQVDGQIHSVSLTIAAGTSQIQRNIVGERILGLPKDRG